MGLFNRIIDKMVSDKVPFKKRKRLIVFVAIITLLSMTTATVAWFSVNTFAGVDKLDLNISLAAQLKVSMENHGRDLEKYGKVITNEMIDDYLKKHGSSLEDTVLDPVTTREGTEFTISVAQSESLTSTATLSLNATSLRLRKCGFISQPKVQKQALMTVQRYRQNQPVQRLM